MKDIHLTNCKVKIYEGRGLSEAFYMKLFHKICNLDNNIMFC